MKWSEVKRRLVDAAGKLRDNKVLDAATKALLRQIPIFGDFAVDLWSSIDGGDKEKSAQLLRLLERVAEREEAFDKMQDLVRESGRTLLSTKASVDEILSRLDEMLEHVRETHAAVDRMEPRIIQIEGQIEQIVGLIHVPSVGRAFQAAALVDAEQKEVAGLLQRADTELADAAHELSPDAAFQLALLYVVDRRYDDAERCFLAVVAREPDKAEAHSGLATIYQLRANEMIGQKNFGLAAASLERSQLHAETALHYDSTDPTVLNQLGYTEKELAQSYLAIGRGDEAKGWLDKARSHFKQVLGLDENDPGAHNGLGNVALLRGDYDEAVAESARAVFLAPGYLFAQHDLAWSLHERAVHTHDPTAKVDDFRLFAQTARAVLTLDDERGSGAMLDPKARQDLDEAVNAATTWLDAQGA